MVPASSCSQFTTYLEAHHLIPDYQSAYRANHGTETATAKLVNDLLWNMEAGHVTILVAMDLSAAFDTVDHAILLDVLSGSYGVKSTALNWLQSYLGDGTMKVQVNDVFSSPRIIDFSLPQSSVAGPILFTAYIGSLPTILSAAFSAILELNKMFVTGR